ncbi:MAG: hypothetical protein KJO81_04195 [Gammaproteobacteria bacterium]|nr:hypothetical protein [Gammaproteobacteria bacterium]NNC66445.1 hypothetical protein [Gammaproteobacteria bacterium]
MKLKISLTALVFFSLAILNTSFSAGIEDRTITLKSNERFDLVQANSVTFKFQPLSEDARKLEITNDAAALGVAYLGQIKLKENNTALSALRSIAEQIGESLDISFGVIADSNTSEALKANELLLLYHPNVTITLALARPDKANDYEIICTYALKEYAKKEDNQQVVTPPTTIPPTDTQQLTPVPDQKPEASSDIAPVEDAPEATTN